MAQHSNYWFNTCPTRHVIAAGLMRNVDVLVIGGGIAGISVLYQLLQSGITNAYLVEDSTIGFHASGRNSGQLMIRGAKPFSSMEEKNGIDYLQFVVQNNRRFLNGLRNVPFDTDLRDTGGLRLATTTEEFDVLKKESEFLQRHASIQCPILNANQVDSMLPNTKCIGGIFVPNEAIFNPYKVVNGMREYIERNGPRILTGCQAIHVVRTQSEGFSVAIRHKGTIRAKKIVYCTNAYTPELVPELSQTMIGFRGQMIATDFISDDLLRSVPQSGMSCNGFNEYWRLHGGRLLVGGMRQAVRGNQFDILEDGEISSSVYDKLRTFVNETLPMFKDIKFTHTWSGIMCATPDQMPLIGSLPDRPDEYILGGFNGYGFSHALQGSVIIKDLITEGESSCPGVDLFNPVRFHNKI